MNANPYVVYKLLKRKVNEPLMTEHTFKKTDSVRH